MKKWKRTYVIARGLHGNCDVTYRLDEWIKVGEKKIQESVLWKDTHVHEYACIYIFIHTHILHTCNINTQIYTEKDIKSSTTLISY